MFRYKLSSPQTFAPSKHHPSDAGYDLYLMELKKIEKDVYYYDTGVSIELPEGYFAMLVGRSSIAQSGYMLANSVGIIDNHYRGNIIVGLRKINSKAADLILPSKLVQLIIMKQNDFVLEEAQALSSTDRQDKGGISESAIRESNARECTIKK
jgi:dUTP pyrophosphatase